MVTGFFVHGLGVTKWQTRGPGYGEKETMCLLVMIGVSIDLQYIS